METSRERYYRLKEEGLCITCGFRPSDRDTVRCDPCTEKFLNGSREANHRSGQKRKEAAMEAYGGLRCVCCGETKLEFLTIDHERGDGAAHRKQMGHGSLYSWLKAHRYPQDLGLRVLCFNCNCSAKWGHICPHENEEDLEYDCSIGLLQYAS